MYGKYNRSPRLHTQPRGKNLTLTAHTSHLQVQVPLYSGNFAHPLTLGNRYSQSRWLSIHLSVRLLWLSLFRSKIFQMPGFRTPTIYTEKGSVWAHTFLQRTGLLLYSKINHPRANPWGMTSTTARRRLAVGGVALR